MAHHITGDDHLAPPGVVGDDLVRLGVALPAQFVEEVVGHHVATVKHAPSMGCHTNGQRVRCLGAIMANTAEERRRRRC